VRCNIITDRAKPTEDVALLDAFLLARGHTVGISHPDGRCRPADVNLYLTQPGCHRDRAEHHISVVDLETLDERWLDDLHQMAQIWVKSTVAHERLMARGFDRVRFTSFLSRDPFDPSVVRERRALHVAGDAQGTATVLLAYETAARIDVVLPPLTVLSRQPLWKQLPPGVRYHEGDLPQLVIDDLLNNHRYHLCLSEHEDWGHGIVEATACQGIVITVDASPMHEHVLPTFGRLIEPLATRREGFVDKHEIDPMELVAELAALDRSSDETLDAMGECARAWSRRRSEAFGICVDSLLRELA
jgi:hypothetical protein